MNFCICVCFMRVRLRECTRVCVCVVFVDVCWSYYWNQDTPSLGRMQQKKNKEMEQRSLRDTEEDFQFNKTISKYIR